MRAGLLVQPAPDLPRYPFPAQHLGDAVTSAADRQFMLLMALALAGRAATDVVDAGRLQAWLAIQLPMGRGPTRLQPELPSS
jgi:hypothetical protein